MLNLARHEVMYYFKNRLELIEIYCFIVTVILLLSFGLRSTLTANPELLLAGLWFAVAAASALGASGLFERDFQSGRLELYQLLPAGMELLVLGKWLAFYAMLAVPLIGVVPLVALAGDTQNPIQLGLGLLAGAADMSLIACFAAALMAGGKRGTALLSLVSLPLMVPIIVFGTAYCRQPELLDKSLLFLAAYGLLLAPLMVLAGASSIRASN